MMDKSKIFIDDITPNYYHPGKSGRIFLNNNRRVMYLTEKYNR